VRSTEGPVGMREAVPLAPQTTLGIGGAARWFLEARTTEDIELAHRWSASRSLALFVLGGGSNLVVADSGFEGLIVRIAVRGCEWGSDAGDTILTAGAGEPWDAVVAACVERGLAGVECLSGIPGTVGGTPIQNVGAYGQEAADVIDHVTTYDLDTAVVRAIDGGDCGFSYRASRFKGLDAGRFVIAAVTFRLRPGPPVLRYPDVIDDVKRAGASSPGVADVRRSVLEIRRRKGMVIDPDDADTRSVGSFFMNPVLAASEFDRVASAAGTPPPAFTAGAGQVKLPAAWLIERAGFHRGQADGSVGISTKHTLALVNRGGATAHDVMRLAVRIKRGVLDRFGVSLRPEPVFVGFGQDRELEFLQS